MWAYTSLGSSETLELGKRLGERFQKGDNVALFGNLGSGKTLLVKGICQGFADIPPEVVQSPTFVYLNIYPGRSPVYHFDVYRMRGVEDFLSMGFEDYFFRESLCCIEWTERIQSILPAKTIHVRLTHLGGDRRLIEIPLSEAARLWGNQPTEQEGP